MNRLKTPVYLMLCLLLILSLFISGCGQDEEVIQESELTVTIANAEKRDIARSMSYTGAVRGQNEVYIMPKVPARVTNVHVQPGDHVVNGQKLLTLDSSDFDAAIKQAEAGLASAKANKRQSEIALEAAKKNYERMQRLHEEGAISDQQLEMARDEHESLDSGSIDAAVAQAEAALMEANNQLENTIITSPINGVVGNISLSLGDTANPNEPAAIVTETSHLEVEVLVGENEISHIQKDSEVDVYIRAAREEPFTGTITSVASAADPMKQSYPVKVSLQNEDNLIKSGMFAQLRINTISADDVLCVPRNAVIPRGGQQVVFIVDEENRARQIEVETGVESSQWIEVLNGMEEGQKVITRGNTLVSDGSLVRGVTGGVR
ncbi:hypothetical protein SYNTR_1857 [Candidatus Syntrophocurvum alkaliphilum]|uniref:Uncharacterized protein n=1 Tax=Candidatus Syntrophocurvum alkaliphilum TaxID=2293317 RepID=A0A6I6DMG4_9FIRM|nr:efflux RND transporter periplasmic adaptor subunit [Candidatus Syntrophocurvum alkaliphilum]QGU00451.1 hypothetical protein SYNTR_1857 [Candidatus Syntrophocurvum alkaliphilum]